MRFGRMGIEDSTAINTCGNWHYSTVCRERDRQVLSQAADGPWKSMTYGEWEALRCEQACEAAKARVAEDIPEASQEDVKIFLDGFTRSMKVKYLEGKRSWARSTTSSSPTSSSSRSRFGAGSACGGMRVRHLGWRGGPSGWASPARARAGRPMGARLASLSGRAPVSFGI